MSASGFYKGSQYVVLSKQRMTAQDIGTGDFLKPNGCVAYLDITVEYKILSEKLAKMSTGYTYLTAKCQKCGKEILLFDSRMHGYDGLIESLEGKERNHDSTGTTKQKKSHCKDSGYKIHMTFSSTGKEDLITETDGLITEENWKDAFDWLTVDLECGKCAKLTKSWQDIETM